MDPKTTTLDVREDIRSGRPPFDKIQSALNRLKPGENLRILAPFEPVPLFALAATKGLRHRSTHLPDGSWEVVLSLMPEQCPAPNETSPVSKASCLKATRDDIIDVDARGLEPPQPMVRILETLANLPPGVKLRAHTDRRPVHLYPHLKERGFVGESEEQTDGSFITHIRPA
jgi:uncharacterized protein (DUF2249 family)